MRRDLELHLRIGKDFQQQIAVHLALVHLDIDVGRALRVAARILRRFRQGGDEGAVRLGIVLAVFFCRIQQVDELGPPCTS